ncbi:MAG: hypothetical protein ACI4TB_07825 [Lachnospiraceae bacterium]
MEVRLEAVFEKGIAISVLVLLCISWSFIRNYILYDGDFIGLATKESFIKAHGIARETYQSQGKSLFSLLFGTTFFPKLVVSFIANYGSATLYTWWIVYVFYLLLLGGGILGAIFGREKNPACHNMEPKWRRVFFHGNMIFCILMPFVLTIQYAYTVDYQAQGRYIMPGLIPIMYYVCYGLEKLPVWQKGSGKRKDRLFIGLLLGIILSLLINIYITALPHYLQTSVL